MLPIIDSVGPAVVARRISLIIGLLQRKWRQTRDQKYDLGEHFHFCRRQKWKSCLMYDFWLLIESQWLLQWLNELRGGNKKVLGCIGYTKREFFFIYIQEKLAETNNFAIFGCWRAEVTCLKWHECVFWNCILLPYNFGQMWLPQKITRKRVICYQKVTGN